MNILYLLLRFLELIVPIHTSEGINVELIGSLAILTCHSNEKYYLIIAHIHIFRRNYIPYLHIIILIWISLWEIFWRLWSSFFLKAQYIIWYMVLNCRNQPSFKILWCMCCMIQQNYCILYLFVCLFIYCYDQVGAFITLKFDVNHLNSIFSHLICKKLLRRCIWTWL